MRFFFSSQHHMPSLQRANSTSVAEATRSIDKGSAHVAIRRALAAS